ncbi:MAG TPA: hypothetical protein VK152_03080 [Paludibacter sp.]|nr:hypothetical protein [Paludibacter sp.]
MMPLLSNPKLRLFVLLVAMFLANRVQSQGWNTARLTVLYGGNIPFNFNTIDKFKHGIDIGTGTILGISLTDLGVKGHKLNGFELNFRSFNNQTEIKGDVYNLPLNRLRVRAENILGLGTGTSYGYNDLATDWVTLFSYTERKWKDLDWTTHQLRISYECGKPLAEGGNGSLLGEGSDSYQVEIEFELVPTGSGF